MRPLQIKEIVSATKGKLFFGNLLLEIKGISTDTRSLKRGDLFIALKGENHDGHSFIEEAFKKGAVGAIVSKNIKYQISPPQSMADPPRILAENIKNRVIIEVKDTLRALGDIAKIYRSNFDVSVIAVSGSNGKTTTKEMLADVLSDRFNTLKAKASFNNFVGVPLTLLEIEENTRMVVLEMETNLLGGMKRLCEISLPLIGVMINIGDTHLQYLKTREGVYKEKAELIESLPSNGVAVLNSDDPYVSRMQGLTKTKKVFSFGIEKRADFRASKIKIKDAFLEFTLNPVRNTKAIRIKNKISNGVNNHHQVKLNTIFKNNIYNALASIAVSHGVFGLNLEETIDRLREFRFPAMRMEPVKLTLGKKDITVINDAFNANPQSMREALVTLKEMKTEGRKIAVLGDMLELGEKAVDFHRKAGRLCADYQIDGLVSVGELARFIAYSAKEAGMPKENIFILSEHREATEVLRDILRPADVVLVKASRKMGLERIVDALKVKK